MSARKIRTDNLPGLEPARAPQGAGAPDPAAARLRHPSRRAAPLTPRRRQLAFLLPISGSENSTPIAAPTIVDSSQPSPREALSTGDAPAESALTFEQSLLRILAADLQEQTIEDAAALGDCTRATAKNIRTGRHLCRIDTFLRLLGGRANMAAEIIREMRRRGLLDDGTAAALAQELQQTDIRKIA